MHIFLMLFMISNFLRSYSICYSCAGTCFNENCNCQMGSCDSDYCYIERKPTEVNGRYRITKGCIKRPSRTQTGCDYDYFRDNVLCVCRGDFCNELLYVRPSQKRNITCRNCSERYPDCDRLCEGQWCHEDSTTGASGCGFGPPSLPYFYKGPEILHHRSRLCVTISRGDGKSRRHCICNTNNCNTSYRKLYPWTHADGPTKTRSLTISSSRTPPFFTCVNCEVSSHDITVTSSCKLSTCVGHFCTYATFRIHHNGHERIQSFPLMTERQGCLNVSDIDQVQLGCTHKWMDNSEEEILCACTGTKCNRDVATANLSSASISLASYYNVYLLQILLLQSLV